MSDYSRIYIRIREELSPAVSAKITDDGNWLVDSRGFTGESVCTLADIGDICHVWTFGAFYTAIIVGFQYVKDVLYYKVIVEIEKGVTKRLNVVEDRIFPTGTDWLMVDY